MGKAGFVPGAVYIGPRKRHVQTAAQALDASGATWPEPIPLDSLDEHQGASVVKATMEERGLSGDDGLTQEEVQRRYFKTFQEITRQWVRAELVIEGYETWQAFETRVLFALNHIRNASAGRDTVVFTSGGPLSVVTGHALGLDSEKMMALSWNIRNIAMCEFLFSSSRFSLLSYNAMPHLDSPDLQTYI